MAELNVYGTGTVNIAEDVLGVIASIAASEVAGVTELSGTFSEEMLELVGKKNAGKGVEVTEHEGGVGISIDIVVDFGFNIPDVARKVQSAVKSAVESMTSMTVLNVDVTVEAINFKTNKK